MVKKVLVDGNLPPKLGQKYTIEDWRQWPDDERWELIEGEAWSMSPAPNREHQKILMELAYQIRSYLDKKSCEIYVAPIDVFLLNNENDEETVVQPDILVVCDPAKLIPEGIKGAPDFIIEILSPSTASKDLEIKKVLYEKHGVKEYWIVKSDGSVFVWLLEGGQYKPATEYLKEMPVPSAVLKDFSWKSRG